MQEEKTPQRHAMGVGDTGHAGEAIGSCPGRPAPETVTLRGTAFRIGPCTAQIIPAAARIPMDWLRVHHRAWRA